MRILAVFLMFAAMTQVGVAFQSNDWPGWRGVNRDDISQETGLMKAWPEGGPKKLWTSSNAGLGYAGFAVVGDNLFTLGLFDDKEYGLCIDAKTGDERWRAELGARFENGWGDGPRNTPTVDGDKVYFMSARGNLVCCDVQGGDEQWRVAMEDFGGSIPFWGFSESPLVDGDKVVCTPGGEQGAIVALDKKTGEKLWQCSDLKQTAHYSSILPIEHNGIREYVQLLHNAVVGLNPDSGALMWSVEFPGQTAVIPTPVFVDGKIYVTAGYNAGSSLIELNDEGIGKEVWHVREMSNHHGGVVAVDGDVFGYGDRDGFACQQLTDGKLNWTAEKNIQKGAVTYADGRFYFIEERTGKVMLIEANEAGYEIKGEFTLEPQTEKRNPRGAIWVHPVISNGRMFLRDQEIICCYDIKG